MSPLACSLLALSALFAGAVAKKGGVGDPDPFCGELHQGTKTVNVIKASFQAHGGKLTLPDPCGKGGKLMGAYIYACNNPNSKPTVYPLNDLPDSLYQKFNIDCPSSTYGCEKMDVKVEQYCDPADYPYSN